MKKIGIVGGIAWLSTVDYYSELCRRSEQRHVAGNRPGLPSTPEMSIESLDLNKAFSCLGTDGDEASWTQYDDYHRAALRRLEASGAEFALMASNTPHTRFASIIRGIEIPVLDLFEAVAKESARIGAREVLILGTAPTMRSSRLRETFAAHGIKAAAPRDETVKKTVAALISELQRGKGETAAGRLTAIAKTPIENEFNAQPVISLACTELPLAFPEHKTLPTFEYDGVVYINTAAVHINAAFEFAVNESAGQEQRTA